MDNKKYSYKGKEYSYSDLQSKYGDRTDEAISKFGFKEVVSEPKYTFKGKEYSHAQLQEKYGDRTDEAISKFGFEQVSSKKKGTSDSSVLQQNLESNSENGSSVSQKYKEGTLAWNQEKIKQNNPEIKKLFETYQTAKSVSDEKRQQIIQSVEDEVNQSGWWNNIKAYGKKGFNTLVNASISASGIPKSKQQAIKDKFSLETNPLANELKEVDNQIKQEVANAKKENRPAQVLTDEQKIAKAKELKIEKEIASQSESQVRSYLKDAQKEVDKFGMSDKDQLNLFQTSELASLSEKDKLNLTQQNIQRLEIDTIQNEVKQLISKAEKGELTEEEYTQLGQELDSRYKDVIQESLKTFQDFVSNQKDIGEAKDNIDVLKRNYGWLKNFADNAGATGLDLTAGLFDAMNWANEANGFSSPNATKQIRNLSKLLTDTSADVRERIAKPISVENINTLNDFGQWFSNTALASQIPIYAAVATGVGGIGALGISATGTQWEEMQGEIDKGEEDYNYFQKTLVPLGYGVSETVSAYVDRLVLMNSARIIRSATLPERQMIAQGIWQGVLNTGKEVGKNAAFEGVDETATEIMQNLMDIYALDKKDVGVFDNVIDASAAGIAMGAIIPFSASIVSKAIKSFALDTRIDKANLEILNLEKALDNGALSVSERTIIESQLSKAKLKNQALLEQEVKNISNLSSEEFEAIKRIERTQSNIKQQAKEIQSSDLEQSLKDQIVSNLKQEFEAVENERIGILNRDSNALLNLLPQEEVIRLKDEASRELMQEQNSDGTKNITIEDKEISQRALENHRKKQLNNEEAQTENIVDDENTRSSNEQLDSVPGEFENRSQGNNEVQEVQPTEAAERPQIIKASGNGREYTVFNEDGRVVFKDKNSNVASDRTHRRLSLEYAKQIDLTEGKRAHEVEGVVESSELANMTVKEANQFIAEKSESPIEVAETILGNEIADYRNGHDYKQTVIAENLGHVSRQSFIDNSDEVHAKEGGSIPIQYLRKDGTPLDTKAKELSEIAGIEITEQDIVDFILENPTGPQVFLNNGFQSDINALKARFEELTGLPATNEVLQEIVNQNENKLKLQEQMTSLDFMSDDYFINLTNEINQYEQETTNRSTEDLSEIYDSKENEGGSRVQRQSDERYRGSEEESSRSREAEGGRVNLPKSTFNKLVQTFQKFFGAGNVHSDLSKLAKVLGQDPNSVFFQKQWENINDTFNSELEQLQKGTLPKGHIFKLGSPTRILQAAGIPNLPIELAASRLKDKSKQNEHPFELSEIKDLAISVQNPLAILRSATSIGSNVILTELEHMGKNFIVALRVIKSKEKIEINDIRSVHYRRTNAHIANWIEEGLLDYADKQKMSEWFSKQRYNSAEVRNLFRRAANIVKNFKNPEVNDVDFQVDYKKLASDNKYTQPKVPTQNIFFNELEVLNRETENMVGKLVDEGKNVSVQSVDVVNIIPTQKNVNINNLKEVQDVRERPLLFKQGDKYYVIDGHHRISNEILEGEKKVEADVYDVDVQFMQTPDGTIWGATYLNEQGKREIYINESALSPETLLHEVYHPFDDIMKQASEDGDVHALVAIGRLDKLAKENGYLEIVQNNPNYTNKPLEQQQAEARVQMIGEIGNKQLDKSFYEKLETAVVDAIEWLAKQFGISIKNYSPEQILNLKLDDIVKASLASAQKGEFKQKDNTHRQNAENSPSANVQNRSEVSPSELANIEVNLSKRLKLNEFIENLDRAIDQLDQFGKENLGMNLPLVVARQALQAMKVAAKTAKSVADIISTGLNAVQQTDWYKNLSQSEKVDLDSNFIDYLNKPYETNRNTRNRDKIEKEIQKALNNGKSEKEIIDSYTDRMEKMVAKDYFERIKPVDSKEAKKQVDKAFETAEQRMDELTKPKFDINKLFEKFNVFVLDRQWKPKFMLNKAGGRVVRNYIITSKGANGHAKYLYEQAYDKVYKGLSSNQIKLLDKVIQLRRFIAIDENRRRNNLPAVVHPDYINENVAKSYLDSLKQELGDKAYDNLIKRADAYFDTFRGLLNDMYESGIISKESRDRFFDIDYQPRQFLEFMQNAEAETAHLDNGTNAGLGKQQIQKLEKGLDSALVTDSQYLLSRALGVRAKTIAMNNTNRRLSDFMKEQAEKVAELKKKADLTKKEKEIIKYFDLLQKRVKDNPIIGFTESGKPRYKRTTPNGYANAYYWINGVKHNMFMEQEFHNQYFDNVKRMFSNPNVKEKVTFWSGTGLIKSIATGNNPAFFIVNTPRDFYNILAFSEEYNSNVPLSAIRLIKDTRKGIKDIRKNTSTFENFVKYGGMTDFLMDQGKFKNGKKVGDLFEKVGLGNKGRERYKSGISFITAQKLQVYSEIGFRMGVFRRSITNQLKELGLKDISEVQDKQTFDDIYINAAASARNTTDFNQGGTVIKDFDTVIPYLNAATQSTRVMTDALNERPLETISRMLQLAVYSSPIPIGLSMMFFSLFKGDEDKDKSNSELYLEAWNGVSKYDRINYFIVFNGKRNANGEFTYYRVAKNQQLTPLFTLIEGGIQKQIKESIGNKEEGTMIEDLKWGFANNISPVDFGFGGFETFAKNPLMKSFIAHSAGYDFFREQDISADRGEVPVAAEGFGSKNVEDFYKVFGEKTGLSPARLKASVESFITTPSTSPYIGLTYDTMDAFTSDKDAKDLLSDFGTKTLKSFSGRVVKETSEYNRRIGNKEKIKEAVEKIEIERLKTKLNFNTLVADLKEEKITRKEINDEIKKLAETEPFEAKRISNRVADQLKNQRTPAFVFEVKYARSAKEKAVLLVDKFGDALKEPSKLQEKEKEIMTFLRRNSAINNEVMYEYGKLVKN